jgi:hypothetical protein
LEIIARTSQLALAVVFEIKGGVDRFNQIVFEGVLLLTFHILRMIEMMRIIPRLDEQLYRACFFCVSRKGPDDPRATGRTATSRGRSPGCTTKPRNSLVPISGTGRAMPWTRSPLTTSDGTGRGPGRSATQ